MIYKSTDEIIALYHTDGQTVTIHRRDPTDKHTMTVESYERWWRLAEMFSDSEKNDSLKSVLEQAEIIYGLSRDN